MCDDSRVSSRGVRTGIFTAVALLSLALVSSVSAATFVVDTTSDENDGGAPNNGCEAADGDICSLREAILAANVDVIPDADTIQIIAALDGQTVSVGSELPALEEPTTLSPNSGIFGINGPGLGGGECLELATGADNSIVAGLALTDCTQGIQLNSATGVQISSMRIGFNANGTQGAIGTLTSHDGIQLTDADDAVIGASFPDGNLISNATGRGILVAASTSGVQIAGNTVGLDALGTSDHGNGASGVDLNGPGTTVTNNTIAGNFGPGIRLISVSATATIRGNRIGFSPVSASAVPNAIGIEVAAGSATIGGPAPADRNVISGNESDGVQLTSDAGGSVLQNNRIGLGSSGFSALPNGGDGIFVESANNLIGTPGAGNVISGNEDQGVHLNNPGAVGNRVESNTIGLGSNGDDPIGNGENGIKIEQGASSNVVGSPAAPNTISGNTDDGVLILDPGSTGNIVSSNRVGTDPAGVSPRGNGDDGIEIDSAALNTIEGNLVSANFETGIETDDGDATNNVIRANVVGLGLAQTIALPNDLGILAEGNNNLYAGNTVAGNVFQGIRLGGDGAGNRVEGNIVGTNSAGTRVIANGSHGIELSSSGAYRIGGPGAAANTVTGNAGAGVAVTGATTIGTILENSIFANEGLGIDIGADGVTANDVGDADSGPNGLQNSPVLTQAAETGGAATVSGSISSAPSTPLTLHLYASASCDPSGSGEGQTPIGSLDIATDGAGDASFTVPVASSLSGRQITATASGSQGTSEYSPCREGVVVDQLPPDAEPVTCQGKVATIVGSADNDKLKGTGKADVINGVGGNDRISGLRGNDVVCGEGGNDLINGGGGRDKLDGGDGRDKLIGGPGKGDVCKGGPGKDRAAKSCEKQRPA